MGHEVKFNPKFILGIETSCDETAAAVVTSDGRILSNVIASQLDAHRAYGGVVPEVAARAHLNLIDEIIDEAMKTADVDYDALDGVAATAGPGLIGGVLVGTVAAKAIAAARGAEYFAINHLEGHALTVRLTTQNQDKEQGGIDFPYLLLLVSGGHTQVLAVEGAGVYQHYGTTLDDAAGEAFDKSAKILGLDLPGGPAIESLAQGGDDKAFDLPRPLAHKSAKHSRYDFSFSGLKTAVLTAYQNHIMPPNNNDNDDNQNQRRADLAASLQLAIAESLASRSRNAMQRFKADYPQSGGRFVLAGGVGANMRIRACLAELAQEQKFEFYVPPVALCTDNGVMIAWAAAERMAAGLPCDGLDFAPRPRWPLGEGIEL